jgi:hypothetical protein
MKSHYFMVFQPVPMVCGARPANSAPITTPTTNQSNLTKKGIHYPQRANADAPHRANNGTQPTDGRAVLTANIFKGKTMQKIMIAKFAGKDARTGAPIRKGDEIIFDTTTRLAWHTDEDEGRLSFTTPIRADYVSHVIDFGNGREYYRNKAGRCEDAPCCGCCTI